MTTKAVAYIRVSSEDQMKSGYSMQQQEKRIREFAAQNALDIVAWFHEARSAKPNAKRPEWDKVMALCREQRDIKVALVYKDNRAMRNMTDFAALDEGLGVRLIAVDDPLPDTPRGRFNQVVGIAGGRQFVEDLAEWVTLGMRGKFEAGGIVTKAPVGYRNVARGAAATGAARRSTVVVDEKKAPIVARAFERYATGDASLFDISLLMAEEGHMSRKGRIVSTDVVRNIFRNPTYIGMTRWHGEVRPGLHPPLVSVELFDRVNRVLVERSREPGEKGNKIYLLRGLLRCDACGRPMTAETKARGSYYHCFQAPDTVKCAVPWSRVDDLDRQMAVLVEDIRLPPERAVQIVGALHALSAEAEHERETRLSAIAKRLPDVAAELNRLVTAYAAGKVPDSAYLTVKDDLVMETARLTEERDRLTAGGGDRLADAEHHVRKATAMAARFAAERSVADKKAVLVEFIRRIHVKDKTIVRIEYHEPYQLLLGSAAHAATGDDIVRALLGLTGTS